jgi:hypothetical protein
MQTIVKADVLDCTCACAGAAAAECTMLATASLCYQAGKQQGQPHLAPHLDATDL